MDRVDEIAVLVTIVDEGSLAAAALAALEERAGARLLEQLWLRRCDGCYPTSPTSIERMWVQRSELSVRILPLSTPRNGSMVSQCSGEIMPTLSWASRSFPN